MGQISPKSGVCILPKVLCSIWRYFEVSVVSQVSVRIEEAFLMQLRLQASTVGGGRSDRGAEGLYGGLQGQLPPRWGRACDGKVPCARLCVPQGRAPTERYITTPGVETV